MTAQEFIFDNRIENVTPLTQQMLDYIKRYMFNNPHVGKILFKARFIITELLTNGVKHAGTGQTQLYLSISDNQLVIEKKDKGAPLPLVAGKVYSAGSRVAIAADAMHTLYAIFETDVQIRFVCEDLADSTIDISQVSEHFGLHIITRAATRFTYRYQAENIFTVLLTDPV